MAEAVRYFFMQDYYPTVIESQVINWLEVTGNIFKKNNIISIISSPAKKLHSSKVEEIEKRINGRYIQVSLSKKPLIRDFQLLKLVLAIYISQVSRSKIVFQSRFLLFYMIAPFIRWLPRLKLVYEARGSAITEYCYNVKQNKGNAKRAWYVRFMENSVLTNSHLIICVSRKQKDFIVNEYRRVRAGNIVVIPGLADSNLFYYSEKLMSTMRNDLGIKDKIIFLYSGRLYRKWQLPDILFRTLKCIYDNIPNSFFIMLTPDQDLAKDHFTQQQIPVTSYMITYADMVQMNPYLNAADYGILFRENLPINNHASPTKFCEYILSGMKAIISEGVGDFSQFVLDHHCGQVVSLSKGIFRIEFDNITQLGPAERERISDLGQNRLSKQSYLATLKDAFSNLLK